MPRTSATQSRASTKKERFEARITVDLKERLERAAALKGMNITTFVVQQIERATEEVLTEHQHRRFSKSDQEAFFHALRNPPDPNESLKAVAARYFSDSGGRH